MAGNWNRCVELAKGEYIKLICADDRLVPESIEMESKAMQKDPDIVMTINDSIMINREGKKLGIFGRYPKKAYRTEKTGAEVHDLQQLFRNALCGHVPQECF